MPAYRVNTRVYFVNSGDDFIDHAIQLMQEFVLLTCHNQMAVILLIVFGGLRLSKDGVQK